MKMFRGSLNLKTWEILYLLFKGKMACITSNCQFSATNYLLSIACLIQNKSKQFDMTFNIIFSSPTHCIIN